MIGLHIVRYHMQYHHDQIYNKTGLDIWQKMDYLRRRSNSLFISDFNTFFSI